MLRKLYRKYFVRLGVAVVLVWLVFAVWITPGPLEHSRECMQDFACGHVFITRWDRLEWASAVSLIIIVPLVMLGLLAIFGSSAYLHLKARRDTNAKN